VFGYDNSLFLEALRERGFYVADQSRSNYIRAAVSIPSSLNMSYINFVEEQAGWDSLNYLPLYDMTHHGQVRDLLEGAGYTIAAMDTDYPLTDWKNADIYLSPYHSRLSEFELVFLGKSAMGAVFDPEFPFTDEFRAFLPLPNYGTRREKLRFEFDHLPELYSIDAPTFAFVHIIAPHPPFVLDRDGGPLAIRRPYSPVDAEGFGGTVEEYRSLYIQQLQYTNQAILQALDSVLTNSDRPLVIIIQGDHGSGSQMGETLEASCMFERTSILNAYYMSDGKTDLLYPSITPVNSFRVIFNTYLGTDYPLLPDRTYYSPYVNPYQFVDITTDIGSTCRE